jgi:hypothetical protein
METFMACGRMGQKIIVSRELDLIVVFTARIGDLDYDPGSALYNDYILQSIALGPDTNQTTTPVDQTNLPVDLMAPAGVISGVAVVAVLVLLYRRSRRST